LKIIVNYGLPFRDDVGVKEETYEIGHDSATVVRVLALVVQRHSTMSRFVDASSDEAQRRHLVVAVNSGLARLHDDVHHGDKVSLLLPVTGGS